jgi:hypothetical protein
MRFVVLVAAAWVLSGCAVTAYPDAGVVVPSPVVVEADIPVVAPCWGCGYGPGWYSGNRGWYRGYGYRGYNRGGYVRGYHHR